MIVKAPIFAREQDIITVTLFDKRVKATELCDQWIVTLAGETALLRSLQSGDTVPLTYFQSVSPEQSNSVLLRALFGLKELGILSRQRDRGWKLAEVLQFFPLTQLQNLMHEIPYLHLRIPQNSDLECCHWASVINRTNTHLLQRTSDVIVDLAIKNSEPSDPSCRVLSKAMTSVMETVPFNSFAAMLYADGNTIQTHFGGNCVLHSMLIKEKLEQLCPGADINCIFAHDKIHTALLVRYQNRCYLVDISAVQPRQPMLLPEKPNIKLFLSYGSSLFKQTPILALQRLSEYTFSLSSFETKTTQFDFRRFIFNSNDTVGKLNKLIRDREYVKRVLQQEGVLVIRVISQTFGVISLFHSLKTNQSYMVSTNRHNKRPINSIDENDLDMKELLCQIGLTYTQLISYINNSLARLKEYDL